MKKYLLFAWSQYYPSGGMNDLNDSFDTLDDVVARVALLKENDDAEYFQLLDKETMQITDII